MKVVMLPLHNSDYALSAPAICRSEIGIPEQAVVSGSTNIWKSIFGDSEILLEGIAELMRRHENYHHVFAGTPRGLDNIQAFVARRPDVAHRFHYIGEVKNIYRFLKTVDFWVNSFPTSGGSDIECALLGIPTIEFLANRNLDLHGAEFLQTRECNVISLREFVGLGSRFITDEEYRHDLGEFLRVKITREFDKERILRETVYGYFLEEFKRKLEQPTELAPIGLEDSIEYEKRIGFFSAFGRNHWDRSERRGFLEQCRVDFPDRPFGWIKGLEEAILDQDEAGFQLLAVQAQSKLPSDYRVAVLQAVGLEAFGDDVSAAAHAHRAMSLTRFDDMPCRLAARIFQKLGNSEQALKAMKSGVAGEQVSMRDLDNLEVQTLPLFYDY